MRAIKALVIGMGVVLLIGIGLLGYGLYKTAAKPASSTPAQAASGPMAVSFGRVTVAVAPGAQVVEMREAGGRLVLLLDEAGGRRIVVLDPVAGTEIGSFVLSPPP